MMSIFANSRKAESATKITTNMKGKLMMRPLAKILSIGLMACGLAASASDRYTPGVYSIDVAHSKVGFEIPHLVISSVDGRFTSFAGEVTLDKEFKKSKVETTVEVKSIDTGVTKRDDHLRSADFFDAEKFPQMSFKSTKIEGSEKSFKLTGDLKIRDVTKQVTFNGKFLGSVKDGSGNQKVAFQATTEINRKDFGLKWSAMVEAGPMVGDKLTIELKIQAGPPLKK